MRKIRAYWWPLAASVCCVLAVGGCSHNQAPDVTDTSHLDTVTAPLAPDFKLQDLNSRNQQLSDYRGKVVILNFWATWCPPCRAEIPSFNSIQDSIGTGAVQFLGIALDDGGDSVVRPWVNSHPVSYPILLPNDSVMKAYGPLDAIPVSFFIDKKGRLRSSIIGTRQKDYLVKVIDSLLLEK